MVITAALVMQGLAYAAVIIVTLYNLWNGISHGGKITDVQADIKAVKDAINTVNQAIPAIQTDVNNLKTTAGQLPGPVGTFKKL